MARGEFSLETEVKRIQDAEQLKQIAEKLFSRQPVTLRERDGEFPAKILAYREGMLLASHDRPDSPTRILILKQTENTLLLECNVAGKKEGTELLKPFRLHLQRRVRGEKRIEVQNKTTLYITNFFPLLAIAEKMSDQDETREGLVRIYRERMAKEFTNLEIHLRRSSRMNPIVQFLQKSKKTIFVPDSADPEAWKKIADGIGGRSFATFAEFENLRRYESKGDFKSEIVVPLSYRGEYIYGYIHASSDRAMDISRYTLVENGARALESELEKRGCLPASREKCEVVDINLSGIGFHHPPNSPFLKSLMVGDEVILDLNFPEGTEGVRGILRNIRTLSNLYRIGVEFAPESANKSRKLSDYVTKITAG